MPRVQSAILTCRSCVRLTFRLVKQEKYLRDLKLCMSVYHDTMAKKLEKQKKKTAKGILARLFGSRKKTVAYSSDDLTAIFGQMPVLIKFSEQLLEDLLAREEELGRCKEA